MEVFYMQTPVGMIHCCQWLPEGKPVGIVQIIHGISEYIGRYAPLAKFLSSKGWLVVGEDHPGHGHSVGEDDQFGYLTGGWSGTVKLIHQLYTKTRREYPGIPYVMLGHSMGSFLLRTYLFTYHSDLSGVMLSGTAWLPDGILPAGQLVCKAEAVRLGAQAHSPLIHSIMFGGYNKSFESVRTPYDWISSDPEVVDAYSADCFCTWKPSIQLCQEMIQGLQGIQKKSNLSRMQKDLPVFFFAGQQDPVGNMGNGVLKAVQAFKQAGMKNVLVELYPYMRHECHNEIGKERVFDDILRWIEQFQGSGCKL